MDARCLRLPSSPAALEARGREDSGPRPGPGHRASARAVRLRGSTDGAGECKAVASDHTKGPRTRPGAAGLRGGSVDGAAAAVGKSREGEEDRGEAAGSRHRRALPGDVGAVFTRRRMRGDERARFWSEAEEEDQGGRGKRRVWSGRRGVSKDDGPFGKSFAFNKDGASERRWQPEGRVAAGRSGNQRSERRRRTAESGAPPRGGRGGEA